MSLQYLGKTLLLIGLGIVFLGGVIYLVGRFGGRLPFFLGRLPGDIRIETEHTRIYIPIATSILLSLLLTAVLWVISRFR